MSKSSSTKQIDDDLYKFVDQTIVPDPNDEILLLKWGDVFYTDKKFKSRVLVMTHYRISVLKPSLTGYSLRQTFLFLHLLGVKILPEKPDQLILEFDEDPHQKEFGLAPSSSGTFIISYPISEITTILHQILSIERAIRFGRPPVRVEVPPSYLEDFILPHPDFNDGLLAAYLAECDRCRVPRRFAVMNFFISSFQVNDTVLNLSDIYRPSIFTTHTALDQVFTPSGSVHQTVTIPNAVADGKPLVITPNTLPDYTVSTADLTTQIDSKTDWSREIFAIISTIRFITFFDGIICQDLNLRDCLHAFALLFTTPIPHLKMLSIAGTKVTKKSIETIANAIEKSDSVLEVLSFQSCDLADSGVSILCDALLATKSKSSRLHTLRFVDCGITGKAVGKISSLLQNRLHSNFLTSIDLKFNKLGRSGTEEICSILKSPECRLEEINLCSTEVDLEKIFETLLQSSAPHGALRRLDTSYCKITQTALDHILSVIKTSTTLSQLVFRGCGLTHKQIVDLIGAATQNANQVLFDLDVSRNPMKQITITALEEFKLEFMHQCGGLFASTEPVLSSLDLSSNNYGFDGIRVIASMFQYFPLLALFIDTNLQPGTSGDSPQQLGYDLHQLISFNPVLKELSIRGDDNQYYLGRALFPLLEFLSQNESLVALDITGNRLGDEGATIIASIITSSISPLNYIMMNNNRFSLKGVEDIAHALETTSKVLCLDYLVTDIDRFWKSSSCLDMDTIYSILDRYELLMDVHEQYAQRMRQRHHRLWLRDAKSHIANVSSSSIVGAQQNQSHTTTVTSRRHSAVEETWGSLHKSPSASSRGTYQRDSSFHSTKQFISDRAYLEGPIIQTQRRYFEGVGAGTTMPVDRMSSQRRAIVRQLGIQHYESQSLDSIEIYRQNPIQLQSLHQLDFIPLPRGNASVSGEEGGMPIPPLSASHPHDASLGITDDDLPSYHKYSFDRMNYGNLPSIIDRHTHHGVGDDDDGEFLTTSVRSRRRLSSTQAQNHYDEDTHIPHTHINTEHSRRFPAPATVTHRRQSHSGSTGPIVRPNSGR